MNQFCKFFGQIAASLLLICFIFPLSAQTLDYQDLKLRIENMPNIFWEGVDIPPELGPKYQIFVEYGDGNFGELTSPSYVDANMTPAMLSPTYEYGPSIPGISQVARAVGTPIYSNPADTVVILRTGDIPQPRGESKPLLNYFPTNNFSDNLRIDASWPAVLIPEDVFTVAVTYRMSPTLLNSGQMSSGVGSISVYRTDATAELHTLAGDTAFYRRYRNEEFIANASNEGDPFIDPGLGFTEKSVFNFDSLVYNTPQGNITDQPRTIFLDMRVRDLPLPLAPNTRVGLLAVLRNDDQTPVDTASINIVVGSGRDPNFIMISPDKICPSNSIKDYTFTLNFQNQGNGPIDTIFARAILGPGWNTALGDIETQMIIYGNDTITDVQPEKDGDHLVWKFENMPLPGSNQPAIGHYLDNSYTSGTIVFTAKPKVFPEDCDLLTAIAEITFGGNNGETIETEEARIDCDGCDDPAGRFGLVFFWILLIILLLSLSAFVIWLVANDETS